jgi:hypothetical protein
MLAYLTAVTVVKSFIAQNPGFLSSKVPEGLNLPPFVCSWSFGQKTFSQQTIGEKNRTKRDLSANHLLVTAVSIKLFVDQNIASTKLTDKQTASVGQTVFDRMTWKPFSMA